MTEKTTIENVNEKLAPHAAYLLLALIIVILLCCSTVTVLFLKR